MSTVNLLESYIKVINNNNNYVCLSTSACSAGGDVHDGA